MTDATFAAFIIAGLLILFAGQVAVVLWVRWYFAKSQRAAVERAQASFRETKQGWSP